MPLLYDLGIGTYHLGIRCIAPWNKKAAAWVAGRSGLWARLEAKAPALKGCLWMHCASVGEFEQGRPVLEAIKKEQPHLPVLLTFFSPSGYEAFQHSPLATHVDHLPADDPANAMRLQRLMKPRAAIFIKYEFWLHHLHALRRQQVPTYLVSTTFRADQPFFRWYGSAWRGMLKCFTHIFTQDDRSRDLLRGIGVENVSTGGDTRFDRVAHIASQKEEIPLARAFKGGSTVLICGSTWPPDERCLTEALAALKSSAPKCIIAPHELHEAQLSAIEQDFPKPLVKWSELEGSGPANVGATLGAEKQGTLLIDRMGLLARLYQYGEIAYVGGGFTDGIHSLLEAAAWGSPVLFGPKHHKFTEAQGLIDAGGGIAVKNTQELTIALQAWFSDPAALAEASAAAARYVQERVGATQRVVEVILPVLSAPTAG